MINTFLSRKFVIVSMSVALFVAFILLTVQAQAQTAVPFIAINSVTQNQTVTICTTNFPSEQSFVVTMGEYGSRGITGYYITTVSSGEGGELRYTFDIPPALQGNNRIAIRLQSRQGYYSFNWFFNTTTINEHC